MISVYGAPWLWYERRIIDDEKLLPLIDHEKVEIYVLYVQGTPAGYFELDIKEFPQIELAYFGLMPEFIGMKLGPYLLGQAIDTAWAHDPNGCGFIPAIWIIPVPCRCISAWGSSPTPRKPKHSTTRVSVTRI